MACKWPLTLMTQPWPPMPVVVPSKGLGFQGLLPWPDTPLGQGAYMPCV